MNGNIGLAFSNGHKIIADHEMGNVYDLLLRLPVGRGGVINSPRSIFLGFFSVSEVWLPLMGDTAGTKLHEPI